MANEILLITIPFPPFEDSYANLASLHPGIEIIHYNTKDADVVPREVWAKATIHLTLYLFAESKDQVPKLEWVHLYSGGINQALKAPLLHNPDIIWTRNGGVHAPQIGEWAMAMLLAHYRQIPTQLKWQESETWGASEYIPRGDLLGKTIGFLGYGAIARHTARIASACGMRVLAYTLHQKDTPEKRRTNTYTPQNTGDVSGSIPEEWYSGDLDNFLSLGVDVLVISVPSTDKTRQSIGREQFEKMKGGYVINLARGDIIRTDELVTALNEEVLCGAALDVTDPEPLPHGHPLWSAKNTIVTPHTSGVSHEYMPRTIEILNHNIPRLRAGDRLTNLIYRSEGY